MELVCKCHELEDENMELAVLKSMLSAVTLVSLQIHGDCLFQIVRTCYNIFLGSKNAVNQATAKASLIQMLIIDFHKMEAYSSFVQCVAAAYCCGHLMQPIDIKKTDMLV